MLIGRSARSLFSLVFCLLVLLTFEPLGAGEPYSWPIDGPTQLTSSFAEYRGDHLHNGIDFSTSAEIGRPVKAVDAGWLDEVFYEPESYGKTVILRHGDGRRTWYSHLDSVSNRIRETLSGRLTPGRTERIDETVTVARGEIIGESGRTGRGPGHLHFALQNGTADFLNPLGRFEPELPYRPQPLAKNMIVYPLTGQSWVDGSAERVVFRRIPKRPLRVWGQLGFDLTLWNEHGNSSIRSMPYRITLKQDGEVVRDLHFDKLTQYRQDTGTYHLYNGKHSNITPTQFTLHMTPGERRGTWSGLSFNQEGRTGSLTVLIQSKSGTKQEYTIPYEVVPPPKSFEWEKDDIRTEERNVSESNRVKNSNFKLVSIKNQQRAQRQYSPPSFEETQNPRLTMQTDWKHNRLRIDLNVENRWEGWPGLTVRGENFERDLELMQVDPGDFVTWWKPDWTRDGWYTLEAKLPDHQGESTVSKEVYVQSLQPGEAGTVLSLDGRYSVFFEGNQLSFPTFTAMKPISKKPIRDGLSYVERPRTIQPQFLKSIGHFEITADLSDFNDVDRIGLYRWNPVANRWNILSYRSGFTDASRVANVHTLGTIALLKDVSAPDLGTPRYSSETDNVIIPLTEEGSGVDRGELNVIDGRKTKELHAVYDPDLKAVKIPAQSSESDSLRLTVEVSDRAGNQASWSGKIEK